jgi:hypothetical protein
VSEGGQEKAKSEKKTNHGRVSLFFAKKQKKFAVPPLTFSTVNHQQSNKFKR